MASELLPAWEHPGFDNSKQEHSRFGNGSNTHMDQSLNGKPRNPSIKLKDPPLGSIYAGGGGGGGGPGHRRLPSADAGKPGAFALKGDMPQKKPPDPQYMRRKTDGDVPRRPQRASSEATDFVFDISATSPMRTKSPAKLKSAPEDRDSTTCEETQSVSDNSSSWQSPASSSKTSRNTGMSSSKRNIMPDESEASYSLSLKDPPIPRSVHSRSLKDPHIPRSVHSRSSKRDPDPPIPRSVEGRPMEYSSSRHSSRRHHEESQPPPLAPYEEEYVPPPRYEEEEYYGRFEGRDYRIHHDNPASRFHDSRSRLQDGSRHSGYHDRDRGRDDRSSRYDRGGDDRSRYDGRPPTDHHRHHHHPRHDRFDDDNVSRMSRSSRYRAEDEAASRRSMPRRSDSIDGGDSRHSRMSRSSYQQDMSVSHPSRFEMDRATGYHHKQRDRFHHHEERHRAQNRYHPRGGGYDDERSRCSRGSRYHDDRSRYQEDDRSRYDERSRYHDDRSRDERSRYHDRDEHSRYHDRDDRSRYDRDDRSRYDERSRYHDRDDGSTIVTTYSRNDRFHDSYSRDGRSYCDHRSSSRHYEREEQYSRDGRREDHYPRDGRYGRSSHSRPSREEEHGRSSHNRPSREEEYGRSSHSRRIREEEYGRSSHNRPNREEEYGRSSHTRPEREEESRRESQETDELHEAKMRAFGLCEETIKEVGGQQSKEGDVFVDIGFGTKAKLRRTKETMDAISRDYYAPATCFACSSDLFCIADVQYIVCPQCKTISPAEAASSEGGTATSFDNSPVHRHGVGLGFTYDTLFRMQSEVMQKRGEARAAAKAGCAKAKAGY